MADFYMCELVDNGCGGVSNGPSTLFVFNDVDELLAHFEEQDYLLTYVIDDEEARNDFVARLGVDDHYVWIVRDNAVVDRLDFEAFGEMVFSDGTRVQTGHDRSEVIADLAEKNPGPIECSFREAALREVAPPSKKPLPPDTWAELRWKVPASAKTSTHLGGRVKLGFNVLTGDFFWDNVR